MGIKALLYLQSGLVEVVCCGHRGSPAARGGLRGSMQLVSSVTKGSTVTRISLLHITARYILKLNKYKAGVMSPPSNQRAPLIDFSPSVCAL